MSMSNALRDALFSLMQGATAIPAVTSNSTYLALLTTVPAATATSTTDASVTEVSTPGYARLGPVTWSAPTVTGGTVSVSNPGALVWGPFTATGVADVAAAALVSTLSGPGSLIFWWPLMQGLTPLNSRSITLTANTLILSLSV